MRGDALRCGTAGGEQPASQLVLHFPCAQGNVAVDGVADQRMDEVKGYSCRSTSARAREPIAAATVSCGSSVSSATSGTDAPSPSTAIALAASRFSAGMREAPQHQAGHGARPDGRTVSNFDAVGLIPSDDRGAMTLQALRVKIGENAFDQLMREWYGKHRNGNASTEQFVTLSEQISGQQLDNFFDVWLHNPEKPVSW
jgi:hypothetical protein